MRLWDVWCLNRAYLVYYLHRGSCCLGVGREREGEGGAYPWDAPLGVGWVGLDWAGLAFCMVSTHR